MSGTTKRVGALLCLAAALSAPVARADVAPPDVTCNTKGSACNNAAPNGVGAGVCTEGVPTTAFGRPSCGPAGQAGATSCLFCQAAGGSGGSGNGNAAGAANTAGAPAAGASSAAGAAGAPTSNGDNSNDDGGCSVRRLGSERSIAMFMLGVGLAALAIGRRRR